MKKTITITTAILFLICFSTLSAHADRKTMEGFMIGTGVAILGTAIINGINRGTFPQYVPDHPRHGMARHTEYGYGYRHKAQYPKKHRYQTPRGHWEVERRWVGPVYEKKWNPGHYTPRGKWIDGRQEKFLVADGFWQEEKVWVHH